MIFNSTIATNDSGNWQNEINVEIEGKANASDNLEGYGITDIYTKTEFNQLIPEILRNIGYRLLDEPSNVSWVIEDNKVKINWIDPDDILTSEPCPTSWGGTLVVRKELDPATHRWESSIVVDETIRNSYQETQLEDEIDLTKSYYYGIFPYDNDEITKHYRWTKIIQVDGEHQYTAPEITSINVINSISVKVNYHLPEGKFNYRKLVYGTHIPANVNDGTQYNIGAGIGGDGYSTINGLTQNTTYYFKIFEQDDNGHNTQSEVVQVTTAQASTYNILNYNGGGLNSNFDINHCSRKTQGYSSNNFQFYDNYAYFGHQYSVTYNMYAIFTTPISTTQWDRICMDVEVNEGTYGDPTTSGNFDWFAFGVFSAIPQTGSFDQWWLSGYNLFNQRFTDYTTQTNYTHTTPWQTMPRTVYKFNMSTVRNSVSQIYIGFYKCDCKCKVYRIWLEKD